MYQFSTTTRNASCFVAAVFISTLLILSVGAAPSRAIIIAVEAEDAALTGTSVLVPTANVNASGGEYLESSINTTSTPSSTDHIGTYSLSGFTPGSYDLYLRYGAISGGANSIFYAPTFGDHFGANGGSGWRLINDGSPHIVPGDPFTDIDGSSVSSPNFGWVKDTITYTASSASEIYQVARREGLDFDALAFVSTGQTVTAAELDTALLPPGPTIPEPSTFALFTLGGLALVRVRRRSRK